MLGTVEGIEVASETNIEGWFCALGVEGPGFQGRKEGRLVIQYQRQCGMNLRLCKGESEHRGGGLCGKRPEKEAPQSTWLCLHRHARLGCRGRPGTSPASSEVHILMSCSSRSQIRCEYKVGLILNNDRSCAKAYIVCL